MRNGPLDQGLDVLHAQLRHISRPQSALRYQGQVLSKRSHRVPRLLTHHLKGFSRRQMEFPPDQGGSRKTRGAHQARTRDDIRPAFFRDKGREVARVVQAAGPNRYVQAFTLRIQCRPRQWQPVLITIQFANPNGPKIMNLLPMPITLRSSKAFFIGGVQFTVDRLNIACRINIDQCAI